MSRLIGVLSVLTKIALMMTALLLSGCATIAHNSDPLEPYNRAMYAVNKKIDQVMIKPLAVGYDKVVPKPISSSISHFFSNLNDVTVILNDLLQFKFRQAWQDTTRFAINSTLGVAGLFDVAHLFGYYKHQEDFGQTLGVWGMAPGPYIVLPLFGPSTLRDAAGLAGDIYTDPIIYVDDRAARHALVVTKTIDKRAQLLNTEKLLDTAAIDEYAFFRDAYQQRRRYLVHDGHLADEDDDIDVFAD